MAYLDGSADRTVIHLLSSVSHFNGCSTSDLQPLVLTYYRPLSMQSLNDYLVHYLNSEPLWSFQQSVQRDALLALPLTELRLVVPITHRDSKDSAIHFIVSAGNAILSNHLHYIAAANDIKPQCGPTSPVAVTRISHAGGLVNSPVKYLIIDDATLFDISSLSSVWNMLARDEVSIIVLGSFEPFPSASARSLYLCGGISSRAISCAS
ncbi:hypothetical protein BT96DRAFT_989501 [Gymnopus androsaceus JB14]|uniref:Uncharacterized protein n=1 Tax=Gymnopus androsaceus JB14 TaxID=1447944 RepID=A0A6A4I2P2_9AGAR|nr:hypothetical protein BT96DRAFT_989501 [Gymnopus androsaceus JB14]